MKEDMELLEIKDVCKRYGDTEALKNVTLQLQNGLYGFLGENGAGKSTLIKILSCNMEQDSGEIFWNGKNIREHEEEYRKIIGYMPQDIVGYEQMRVKDFLEYIAILKGMKGKSEETRNEIGHILAEVHLEGKKNQRFCQLSGGMKRRLLFAQAILGNPKLLILDEPTAGLDPNERIAIRNLISRTQNQRVTILATHIISDIECIAGQIVIMKKGKVIGVDSPENWLQSIYGQVREVVCSSEETASLEEKYIISSMRQATDGIHVRVLEDVTASQEKEDFVMPSLEEVYLYYSKLADV